MDVVGLIAQLVGGAAGGYGTGKVASAVSINPTVDAIVGLIGGFAGSWIAAKVPGLEGLLSGGGTAYVGQAATGLVGGGVVQAVVGLIKNNFMK